MTLPLTPETLAAAYDFLRTTPPFNRFNLPEPEDVTFRICRTRHLFGYYEDGAKRTIAASSGKIAHTGTLMRLVAHEMVHMHLAITGLESRRGGPNTHNTAFRKIAAVVCAVHGFDPKEFY